MKRVFDHTLVFAAAMVCTYSLFATSGASPVGINDLFGALSPSATGKPNTTEYTLRNFMDDRYKGQIGFLHEICPPLARVVDQVCQSMQTIIQRCIGFFTGGGFGNGGRGETTTRANSDGGDGTSEETTPSSGNTYDQSNPKFGGSDQSTSSESSSSDSSSESSNDKSSDKEAETTTTK